MDPLTGAALIGGGSALVGGLINQGAMRDANQIAKDNAANNVAMQKEFAQNGIRWKIADAKASGVHPLYALGAQTQGFSPVTNAHTPDTSMGDAMGQMGQNISRAVAQTKTASEKEFAALQMASARADLDGKLLHNQLLQSQIKSAVSPNQPAFPGSDNFIPGQGNSPTVKVVPSQRTHSQSGRLAQEAGWVPDVAYARTDTGFTPVPSKDVKERIEDQLVPETMWAIRNQLTPNFSRTAAPPASQLPPGAKDWHWSVLKQEWQPDYGNRPEPHLRQPYRNHQSRFDSWYNSLRRGPISAPRWPNPRSKY